MFKFLANFSKKDTYQKLFSIAFVLVLLTGLVLRFYQYLMKQNLWEDETHFALNFIRFGYIRLLQPLDFIQAAPVFFILSVKTMVKIFGYGELAFRLVPFVATVLTLPLFYYIVLELTKNRVIALLAFFIFSVNLSLIYFSAQLKPYAIDVASYLVLVYIAIGQADYIKNKRHLLLGVAGCIFILFSSTAFIILFCIACQMLLNWSKQKTIDKADIKVLIAWACVFIPNYFIFIHNHPATADQRLNYAFAFCPTEILSCEFILFIKKTITETFFTMLLYISREYYFSYVLLVIFVVAIRHIIIRKKYTIAIFICLPILVHLGLSALKLYPFWFRLILYLMPCFIFMMALGTYLIAEFFIKKIHISLGIIVILTCSFFFTKDSIEKFPLQITNIKPALDFVNDNLPNAHVYIMDPVNAYTYYNIRGYAKNPVYKAVPWEIDPPEFFEFTSSETSNYVLFYAQDYRWGYGDVIEELKKRGLIVKSFENYGYSVSEVKPILVTNESRTKIDHSFFDPKLVIGDDKEIAVYGGSIISRPVMLQKGKYETSIISRGDPAAGVFPHLAIYMNENKIGDYDNTAMFSSANFSFEVKQDTIASFKITMENDAMINGQDRNSFIKYLILEKRSN